VTDNIVQTRVLTCDRCGTQKLDLPPDAPYPANWRHLTMMHPDTGAPVEVDLHPACTRDYQEKFMQNLPSPPRTPGT